MHSYLQTIAIHGMKGKKRSMAYMFLVLFLSMAFVVVNVSISGSLKKTREQLRYEIYGDWDIALFHNRDLSNDKALKDERILDYGTFGIYGSLLDEKGTPITCLGSLDDKLWELGHLAVESGRFPREANEIAVEADVLSQLGYDYRLGQTITLRIWDQKEAGEGGIEEASIDTREYILCGVIRGYTKLWVSEWGKLAGAVLSPEGAEALGRPVSYQYFLQVEDEDPMTATRMCRMLKKDYDEALVSLAWQSKEEATQYHLFNLYLILITTIVAIVAIYSIQLKEQRRSIQLFRMIGATKGQLSVMIFFETIWMLVPAAFGGLGAGSLITWGILQLLMQRNVRAFYIDIPIGIILGMTVVWFGAVFLARLVIFRYAVRGRLMEGQIPRRKWAGKVGHRRQGRRLGLALLSAVLALTGIFCYVESLLPIRNDTLQAENASYIVTGGEGQISEEYLEKLRKLPGVAGVTAWTQWRSALEFPGIEENPFCQLLAENREGTQPGLIEGYEPEEMVPFPKGVGSSIFVYSQDCWELLLAYADAEIEREEFASGEAVILYLPYNVEGGIKRGGEVYREFGVKPGDEITVTVYGRGELVENGNSQDAKNGEEMQFEEYEEPREASRATGKVAGIITEDLMLEPRIVCSGYYTVLCSQAFADKLLEGEEGIQLEPGLWTNQEFGYRTAAVYTGMDADFLSTDSVMAEAAVQEGLRLDNRREQNTAYRQEQQQTLIQLWVSGACMFLVVLLVLMNLETILGISRRRSYALWRMIGMSRGRLRLRLLWEGGLLSLVACLLGHMGYLLFLILREAGHYRRLVAELGEMEPFGGWFRELLRYQLELVDPWWYLAVCILCMLWVFLLFYCSQNRVLKGTIRDNMQ